MTGAQKAQLGNGGLRISTSAVALWIVLCRGSISSFSQQHQQKSFLLHNSCLMLIKAGDFDSYILILTLMFITRVIKLAINKGKYLIYNVSLLRNVILLISAELYLCQETRIF
jgi:hypothetical protein